VDPTTPHCAAPGERQPISDQLPGPVNRLGIRTGAVLIQEFAAGTEYIVDGYAARGLTSRNLRKVHHAEIRR
jgi:hypothetical protein